MYSQLIRNECGCQCNRKSVEILIKALSERKEKKKGIKEVTLDNVSDTMVTADQRRRLPAQLLFGYSINFQFNINVTCWLGFKHDKKKGI